MRFSKSSVLQIGMTVVGLIAIGSFAQGQGPGKGAAPVTVVNTASNPVPVAGALEVAGGVIEAKQSGTWSVGLSDPVAVAKQAPITGGGGGNNIVAGDNINYGQTHEASGLMVWFTGGTTELILSSNGDTVARLRSSGTGATESVQMPLSRPVAFDSAACFGPAGRCNFSWIGNAP